MATENGVPIMTREEFLTGQTISAVREYRSDGYDWTVLSLESGRSVHIREDCGWVLVEPEVH